jgi:TolB-like protein/DNA-binding winged helix-turn-helix (wHTH) protein/Tfp pilus assembly protein PilF
MGVLIMNSPRASQVKARFGSFEMDLRAGELRKHGVRIRLQTQPFQILGMLLERPGEVVTREELRQALWPGDTFVDFDHGLNNAINRLREALGDSAESPRFLETLPRRGYRFIAAVESIPSSSPQDSGAHVENSSTTLPTTTSDKPAALPVESLNVSLRTRLWIAGGSCGAALLVLLFSLNTGGVRQRLLGATATRRIQSIVVLPLENLSGDPSQEYFADGMTDELITQLAQIGGLRVISRTTAMQYKGTRKSVLEIGRELHVDGIVEGTVFRSGEHVRISAQLVDSSTDQHVWAQSYERDLRDILALQKEVAEGVARQVRVNLLPGEQPRAVNPQAYEAYLRGRHDLNAATSKADLEKSIADFNSALAKDPQFALAYSGLALSYLALADFYLAPHEAMPKAEEAARKALALDGTLSEAHDALGYVELIYRWDWPAAQQQLQRAIELNPGNALAQDHYAAYLSAIGRHSEAFTTSERARALDPLSLLIQANNGVYLFLGREYDRAIERERNALEFDAKCYTCRTYLALALAQSRRLPEALKEARLVRLSEANPLDVATAASAIAAAGQRAEAEAVLGWLQQLGKQRWVCPYELGTTYLALGDKEQALRELENAYQAHSICMVWAKNDPRLDPLRSEPRFQAILQRMSFPQ